MANAKLPASADFFKQLSLECQQLKLTIELLETFAFRASIRGRQLGDRQLLTILEQSEVVVLKAQHLLDILKAFQVSGALLFGIRPSSRIQIRSSGSPLERLPEFLKCFEYNIEKRLCMVRP